MRIRQLATSAAFATGLAALPLSAAQAQFYAPCPPSLLALPFCVAGAAVATAATIAATPFWLLAGAPPLYYPPPVFPAPVFPAPAPWFPPPMASSAPATVPQSAPPATTHPPASGGSPSEQDAYYFCPASKGYYPYVQSCAVAWRSVPVTPPQLTAGTSIHVARH